MKRPFYVVKQILRKDINSCIKSASTYEEFLLLLRSKGYEIKGERKATIPKKNYASRKLIDTSDEKFQNSPAY